MANDPKDPKKDLTGILDLQKLRAENPEAVDPNAYVDPDAVNELQKIEQVDEFQSIDQIGMMDHPDPNAATTSNDDPFVISPASETPADDDLFAVTPQEPLTEFTNEFSSEVSAPSGSDEFAVSEVNPEINEPALEERSSNFTPSSSSSSMSNLRNYSENSQSKTSVDVKVHYPFHLKINGSFGPYERDKLLLFITDHPIGLSSSDLDLQIRVGKVFLPRISEYAAVKLVQELRDSGLSFDLQPSDREGNETTTASSALSYHYQSTQNHPNDPTLLDIPVLNPNSMPNTGKAFQQIDEVSIVQYVRTEMMEVENSPMIQEVMERMTEALKQKARLKGGNALLNLKQEITPLRLPSQYQISLKASVIRI